MKTMVKSILIVTLGIGMALPAMADAAPNRDRSYNQNKRIKEGIRSGELTREEARTLKREQRKILQMRRDFLRDGRVTKRERKVLVNNLNRASKHIYSLRHNKQRTHHRYRPYSRHSYPLFGQHNNDSNRSRRHDYRYDYRHDYRYDYRNNWRHW